MDDSKKPKKKLKKRYLISLILFIALIAAIIYFVHFLSKPVSSSVTTSEKALSNPSIYNIDLTPVLQNGKYVSFNYPKGLNLVSKDLADQATSLESYNYYVKDIYSWTLAINISQSTTGIKGLSAYMIRAEDPSVYSQSSQVINNQPVVIITDTSFVQGFSKVAFLSNGGYVATVSLVGNDTAGSGPLEASFNMVLSSWQWKI